MQGESKRYIGDYEILNRLGAGGMGEVYKVRNVISDRIEAMKILLPSLVGNKQLDDRFRREIKLVASLNHPNIASLCTALTIETQFVMVMEYVEGVTIEALLHQGPIPVPQALSYMDQAVDALGFAHRKGIIHRDIKPANLMLMSSGTVKLMDFGIARGDAEQRITQTGQTMGTFHYMSPEQIMGLPTDARSDLYSIGISLYEMVTGKVPFTSDSAYKIQNAHLNEAPRHPVELQPHLPLRLNQIILKLLAKRPEDRFQSADELRAALRTVTAAPMEVVVPQQIALATTFEHSPTVFGQAQPGRGSTSFMDPMAFAPDMRQAAPLSTHVNKAANSKRALVAGVALSIVGAAAAATYVSRSHKEPEIKQAASALNNTPVVPPKEAPSGPPPSQTPVTPKGGNTGVVPPSGGPTKANQFGGAAAAKQGQMSVGIGVVATVNTPGINLPPGPTQEERDKLDALDHQLVGYDSRAGAYNNRLNMMQEQMRRQGLSLRSDIVTAQESMNNNLYRAKQSLQRNDAKNAEEFATQAKNDLDTIESFLHPK